MPRGRDGADKSNFGLVGMPRATRRLLELLWMPIGWDSIQRLELEIDGEKKIAFESRRQGQISWNLGWNWN